MIRTIFVFALFLVTLRIGKVFAQTSNGVENGKTKVEIRLDYSDVKVSSKVLMDVLQASKNERSVLLKRLQMTADPCLISEISADLAFDEFLIRNAASISGLYENLAERFRVQFAMIKKLQLGNVSEFSSVKIVVKGEDGTKTTKLIQTKDLIAYVLEYNDLSRNYAENEIRKKLFEKHGLTFSQAVDAYLGLNLYFDNTQSERIGQRLEIISGIAPFQVVTSLKPGWIENLKVRMSSLSDKEGRNSMVSFARGFDEVFKESPEQLFWQSLRSLQITIDENPNDADPGIPIDGLLRREYLESKRNWECRSKINYIFDSSVEPGPGYSTELKRPCDIQGIKIISATIGRTPGQFNITKQLQLRSQSNKFASEMSASKFLPGLGLGCAHVYLEVDYQCGCLKQNRLKLDFKADRPFSFGCD